jgi:hypothetical protein
VTDTASEPTPIVATLLIEVEGSIMHERKIDEIFGFVGVIKIAFSDWPMPRELWKSSPHTTEEDANREAHDQLCDVFRFMLNSRENGASK